MNNAISFFLILCVPVFAEYKKEAGEMGFLYVASGPLIRSSYGALEAYEQMKIQHEDTKK
jgi:lipoate synthase